MMLFEKFYDKLLNPFNYSITTFIEFLVIILIFLVFSSPLTSFVIGMVHRITHNKKRVKESSAYKPLKTFFCAFGVFLATYTLTLSQEFSLILHKIFRIMCILLISKAFINFFSNKKNFKILKNNANKENKTLISFFDKVIIFIIYIITGFIIILELGYNLNGLIAGLGIGSAVIALAAQDIVKSLISSFVIITEKPYDLDLGITLETPLTKLNKFIETLKLELTKVSGVENDTINIHLGDIKSDSINVYIYLYIAAKDYSEYLDQKEKVNYTILNLVDEQKIALAYPTQTVYVKK